jgi:hypothetical protein
VYKSTYNKDLKRFKNIHKGESAIVFATGSTINDYEPFEGSEKCIKFGLNRIYKYKNLLEDLDYYFFGSHYYVDEEHRNNVNSVCENYDFIKFASAYEEGRSHGDIGRGNISPEDAITLGAIPFENNLSHFTNDVSKYATLGHSIVFPPLQILLYMGISTLYLVGTDGGFTVGTQSGDSHLLQLWSQFKTFKEQYYKDVRIVSINPVSLQGWFEDAVVE